MGCGNEISVWDNQAVQESLDGKNNQLDPVILAEVTPVVEERIFQRCLEIMREDAEINSNHNRDLIEGLSRDPDAVERLDFEVKPSDRDIEEIFNVSLELGMKHTEIIGNPSICGTKNVPDMSGKIRDVITVLHNSKISQDIWGKEAIEKIMFIDSKTASERGIDHRVGGFAFYENVIQELGLPKTLHIVLDEKGDFKVDCTMPNNKALLWLLAHEACHLNCHLPPTIGTEGEIQTGPVWGVIADNVGKWDWKCRRKKH